MSEEVQTEEEVEVSVEEAQAKTGIRESAGNEDVLEKKDDTESENEPEEVAMPSFFIEDDDRIRIEVDCLFNNKTGKLESVVRSGILELDDIKALASTTEWFDFTPVNYDDMNKYRQKCSTFNRQAKMNLVDPISLRNYLVVWHLKDWSIKDRKGNKIELGFSDSGALDDESIDKIYKINSTLMDVVLTHFEKDMMM